MTLRSILKWISALLLIGIIIIVSADLWVTRSTKRQMYDKLADVPFNKVGLLLGTSKYLGSGSVNLFYKYRIDAASALYHEGKIRYILISGDNGSKGYNEPEMMRDDLIAAGVPASRIILDYAGFRTLDSIMRCRDIFGEDHITIISQPFHNQRALFIANRKNFEAVAFNAEDVPSRYAIKVTIREKLARVKMLLDLLMNKQPKFYGERIPIAG